MTRLEGLRSRFTRSDGIEDAVVYCTEDFECTFSTTDDVKRDSVLITVSYCLFDSGGRCYSKSFDKVNCRFADTSEKDCYCRVITRCTNYCHGYHHCKYEDMVRQCVHF
jgi:hypothetical protein